jgi:hypothetical protein
MIPAQESSRSSVLSAGEGVGRHFLAVAPGLYLDGQVVYFDGLLATWAEAHATLGEDQSWLRQTMGRSRG